MTRVIKEITFHLQHWLNNHWCHQKSLENYSTNALNTHHHFFFPKDSFNEHKLFHHKNPNNYVWDDPSPEEGKNSH
jgi:hypothetical protein